MVDRLDRQEVLVTRPAGQVGPEQGRNGWQIFAL